MRLLSHRLALSLILLAFLYASDAHGESPLQVCLVSGSNEYDSGASLDNFRRFLEKYYIIRCILIQGRGELNRFLEPTDLPGLEAIEHCDVVLLFTRRVTIPKNQLDRIKAYVESGRPIVAVRTASHGFQDWLEFDKDVLGGNYQGHFGPESKQTVTKVPGKKDHPILKGVGKIRSKSVLYVTSPLSPDAELLMVGSIPQSSQPSAWTRIYKGGRIFYTALGSYDDFADPSFRQLLVNALFWATGRNQEKQ